MYYSKIIAWYFLIHVNISKLKTNICYSGYMNAMQNLSADLVILKHHQFFMLKNYALIYQYDDVDLQLL